MRELLFWLKKWQIFENNGIVASFQTTVCEHTHQKTVTFLTMRGELSGGCLSSPNSAG
jgi:hypothetical protein